MGPERVQGILFSLVVAEELFVFGIQKNRSRQLAGTVTNGVNEAQSRTEDKTVLSEVEKLVAFVLAEGETDHQRRANQRTDRMRSSLCPELLTFECRCAHEVDRKTKAGIGRPLSFRRRRVGG